LLLDITDHPQQELQVYATSVNNERSKPRYLTEYVPTAPSEQPHTKQQKSSSFLLIALLLLLLVVVVLFVLYLFQKLKLVGKDEVGSGEEDSSQRGYQFQEVPRFEPATGLQL